MFSNIAFFCSMGLVGRVSNEEDEEKYDIKKGQIAWFPTTDDEDNDWFLGILPEVKKHMGLQGFSD